MSYIFSRLWLQLFLFFYMTSISCVFQTKQQFLMIFSVPFSFFFVPLDIQPYRRSTLNRRDKTQDKPIVVTRGTHAFLTPDIVIAIFSRFFFFFLCIECMYVYMFVNQIPLVKAKRKKKERKLDEMKRNRNRKKCGSSVLMKSVYVCILYSIFLFETLIFAILMIFNSVKMIASLSRRHHKLDTRETRKKMRRRRRRKREKERESHHQTNLEI